MNEARKESTAQASPALAGSAPTGASSGHAGALDGPAPDTFATLPWGGTWLLLLSLSAIIASVATVGAHAGAGVGPARGLFLYTLAILICLLAAVTDAATLRIPWMLTYPAMGLGLLLNCLPVLFHLLKMDYAARWLGAVGPVQALAGFSVCAILGIVGVLAAGVGGGDAKLLAALGALLGLSQVGAVLLVALTMALLYAVINLAVFGHLTRVLRFGGYRILEVLYVRRFDYDPQVPARRGLSTAVPMAVPLAIGLIVARFVDFGSWLVGGN